MLKYVKVNFFQKRFDSLWRNFLFDWHQGDYLKYIRNRMQWYLYPSMQRVSSFPLHLDIETAATCNLRCPMCASRHISDEKYKDFGRMDGELFKRIIDEAAEHNLFSVRLSWRGEVFTHPELLEMIYYAKVVKKIPQVSFLTNGFKLKGRNAEALIEYGVDYISVSVDGMDEMYEHIRKPMKFEEVYRNLSDFQELKKKMNRQKPLVRITALWPAIAGYPDEFYSRMSKVSDKIVYNPLKDYNIKIQDRTSFVICQFLFERLFISWDGKVHPCSNAINEFVIDDLNEKTVREIWHGEKMAELRRMHQAGKRLDVFPCNECSYGVDYEKLWKDRDWSNWNPNELVTKQHA